MYALTDVHILRLLEEKVKNGVSTTLFYDPSASPHLAHIACAQPVKGKGLMHKKIIVIDEESVFLGSANMTLQSLTMHDNFVAGFFHPPLAQFITSHEGNYFSFTIEKQRAEMWLLPDVEEHALKRLLEKIHEAKEKIYIALFTFTYAPLTQALLEAAKRGVTIALAVDFYTGQGASLKTVETLTSHLIPVYLSQGKQLLHHKWALIDDQTFIFGSANWTEAAFTKNQDYFLILEDLTEDQLRFIHTMWETLKMESA